MVTKRNPDLTREKLLTAAFQEIYAHGYRSASLDGIISAAGVTKGALYHHFANKQALGYAVLEEVIRQHVVDEWIRPMATSDDPVGRIFELMQGKCENMSTDELINGCPLNNLAQEMAGVDEGFRERVMKLFELWHSGFADAFRRGQKAGTVRADVNPDAVAAHILATFEGALSMAKVTRNVSTVVQHCESMVAYLESIRIVKN